MHPQLLEAAAKGRVDDVLELLSDGAHIEFKSRVRRLHAPVCFVLLWHLVYVCLRRVPWL